jgi:hypothetical protein
MIIVVLKKVVTHNIVWRISKRYAMPVARDVVACDGVVAGIFKVYTPSIV